MRLPETLSDHLRAETGPAHAQLEGVLDLLRPPLERERFLQVLIGFHSFHRAWEPAIARQPAGAMTTSRLDLLRQDLRALGFGDAEIDALPSFPEAGRLGDDPLAALGSVYVMEGSALGGQVIGRALAEAPWAPPDGLRYFNPYGAETGQRWRAFKAALNAAAAPSAWPAVVAGAADTFTMLAAGFRQAGDASGACP